MSKTLTKYQKDLIKNENTNQHQIINGQEKEEENALDRIQHKIFSYVKIKTKELSKTMMQKPQLRAYKKGKLPNFFPKKEREESAKFANEQSNYAQNMMLIDKPYRFCMYPVSEINVMQFCDQNFKSVSNYRCLECKHKMCLNCCNNLVDIMQVTIKQSTVSKSLNLTDADGMQKIENFITKSMIEECRAECYNAYPVEQQKELPPVPKDISLGKSADNPGKSCNDILLHGGEPKSEKYWILTNENQHSFQMYCDQETNGGGWSLFYAYKHLPFEDYQLNEDSIPLDPESSKSHIHLKSLGYSQKDIKDLRFFCRSNHDAEKPKFLHFTVNNPALILAAVTGDQSQLQVTSFKQHKNQQIPYNDNNMKYTRSEALNDINEVGSSMDGGFWNRPFQSRQGGWSIKGESEVGGRWECGDKLDLESGASYDTLHQVWFRAYGPSKEEGHARLSKIQGKQQ